VTTEPLQPTSTKPASEMTDEDWFNALYTDAFEAMLEAKRRGDLKGAKNAASDMYLAASDYLRDEQTGVWAYLYDWAGDVTHALIDAEEKETRS